MAQATVYSSSGQQQNAPPPPPPKPPWKQPYRDGHSRAAQHYDLFEMIRHPNLAKENRPPDPLPQKKYATKQQQIEGELEKKFKRSAPTGVLVALIKAFIFAVCFPFYVLFIALPRWIYTTIAYYLALMKAYIKRKIEAVQQFFIRRYHNVVDPFKKLWKKMSDLEKNKLAIDFEDDELGFFAFLAMGVYYAYSGIVRPAIRSIKAVYKGIVASYVWLVTRPQKMREAIARKWAPVAHFIAAVKAYPGKLLKRLKERLLVAIWHPLLDQYNAYITRIHAARLRLRKAILETVKSVKEAILHPVQTYRRLRDGFKKGCQRKVEQIKAAWQLLISRPIQFLKRVRKRCTAFFAELRSKLPKIRIKLPFVGRLKKWKQTFKELMVRLVSRFAIRLPRFARFSMPSINLSPRHLDKLMKAAVYKLFIQFSAWIAPKAHKLQQKYLVAYAVVARPFRVFNAWVEVRLEWLQKKYQRCMRPIRRFAHRRILRIRVFIGWIRVVARHSLKTFQDRALL